MKKRIAVFLLCGLLLSTAVGAENAGTFDDPLISLSYIADTFLPQIRDALQKIVQYKTLKNEPEQISPGCGLKTVMMNSGDSLDLASGQQIILISGSMRLNINRGRLLNVTAGRDSSGGDARIGNRYILCGDSSARATIDNYACVVVSEGAKIKESGTNQSGVCPFTDVHSDDWFFNDVVSAYNRGFINGVTSDSYAPQNKLTVAQAIKLAACMHQRYNTGAVSLQNADDGRAWYMSYVDYAVKNGLMENSYFNYNAEISRGDFVKLFYEALPEKEYSRINTIMDGAIPDIATDAPLAKQVYTFYMAGILTGYAEGSGYLEHAFGPDSTISRAEVAAIMSRMFDPSLRKHFSME